MYIREIFYYEISVLLDKINDFYATCHQGWTYQIEHAQGQHFVLN